MKLEHWSSQPNLLESGINPDFHGKGVSGAESKRKRNSPHNWVNRSYHYVSGTAPEPSLGAKGHVYTSEVPDEKIYDFQKDPLNLKAKSRWGNSLDLNEYEKNIRDAGFHGYINRGMGDDTMSAAVALFHTIKPISVKTRDQMSKSDDLAKGKNARAERRRIFGSDPNAARLSPKRMKMMQALANLVGRRHGVEMAIASGKRDAETGELREDPGITHEPYDVLTPEGQRAEAVRQGQIDAINRERVAAGKKPVRRTDPKPDWRSGKLETQPSPDAAAHEIAHFYDEPAGQTLGQMQTRMDDDWGQTQKKYGHLQQKKTRGEIQPMSMENPIRRRAGIPPTSPSKNPRPLSEHDRPVEQAVDGSGPRFVRGIKPGKNPKSVDYDRSSRLMSPETRRKMDMIDRGEIVFDKVRGWVPGTSVNARINQRARAAYEDPNPETNFARKDRDTLMRSMKKTVDFEKQRKEHNAKASAIRDDHEKLVSEAQIWSGYRNKLNNTTPGKPAAPQPPIKKSEDGCKIEMLRKLSALAKMRKACSPMEKARQEEGNSPRQKRLIREDRRANMPRDPLEKPRPELVRVRMNKTNVPHPPESAEDKAHDVVEGQQSLKSALKEGLSPEEQRRAREHLKSARIDPRSRVNRAAGADVPGVIGKSEGLAKQTGTVPPPPPPPTPGAPPLNPSATSQFMSGFLGKTRKGKSLAKQTGTVPPPPPPPTPGAPPLNPDATSKFMAGFLGKAKKWPVPGMVPPSGDKSKLSKEESESVTSGRVSAYSRKRLGSFSNGKILHNDANHSDHASFDKLDHMRAASIHSDMADKSEAAGMYPEAAHHRKQAATHRSKFKVPSASYAGSMYKSVMDATRTKGSNPTKSTLNTGEQTATERKILNKNDKPANSNVIQLADRPTSKAANELANTERLIHLVKKMTSGERPMKGEPPYIDQQFKDKLAGIMKKAQYAKTGDPEDRKKALKAAKLQADKKKKFGEQLKADTIKYLDNQRGESLTSDNPGSKDRAKSTLRGVKGLKTGELLNKPE